MDYIISLLLGSFIGAFPTAYMLVRWRAGLDIRRAGSGNVGAMNAYEVTESKFLGLVVGLFDAMKGIAAIWLSSLLFGQGFWISAASGLGSVLGHNYSPWLRFKGGRGLATGLGVMIMMGWFFVPVWIGVWILTFLYSRDIHYSNVSSSLTTPLAALVTPPDMSPPLISSSGGMIDVFLLWSALCFLFLMRHTETLKKLWVILKLRFHGKNN